MKNWIEKLSSGALAPRVLVALGAFAAGFQVVSAAPASLALAFAAHAIPGFSAAKAEGTLWSGALRDARYGDVQLGDVDFALRGISLFAGRLSVDAKSSGGALISNGRVSFGLDGRAKVTNATLEFDLAAAHRYSFLGAPLTGKARASIRMFESGPKGCKTSDGAIWTDVLSAPAQRLSSEALELSGSATCVDGSIVANLYGEGIDGKVEFRLTVAPDLTYGLAANAFPARREVADALRAFGFRDDGDGLTIAMSGALKGRGL